MWKTLRSGAQFSILWPHYFFNDSAADGRVLNDARVPRLAANPVSGHQNSNSPQNHVHGVCFLRGVLSMICVQFFFFLKIIMLSFTRWFSSMFGMPFSLKRYSKSACYPYSEWFLSIFRMQLFFFLKKKKNSAGACTVFLPLLQMRNKYSGWFVAICPWENSVKNEIRPNDGLETQGTEGTDGSRPRPPHLPPQKNISFGASEAHAANTSPCRVQVRPGQARSSQVRTRSVVSIC